MKDTAPPAYVPQTNSLPGRVCAYFRHPQNRDEELTTADIATKFDALRASVPTSLAPAIAADLLRKIKSRDGTCVIVAGARLNGAPPASAPPATPVPPQQAAAPATKPRQRFARGTLPPLDLNQYPVTDKVACPPPATCNKGASKYEDLFAALERPGQSRQGLPNIYRSGIGKVCQQMGKRLNARFVCRSARDGTFGVWRMK